MALAPKPWGGTAAREALAGATSERELQDTITQAAELLGYLVHHETDSRRTHAGWPDLFLCHPESGWWIILELKSEKGRLTAEQAAWLTAMGYTGPTARWMVDRLARRVVGVVRPQHLDDLLQRLTELA